jgi:hypothetical protein
MDRPARFSAQNEIERRPPKKAGPGAASGNMGAATEGHMGWNLRRLKSVENENAPEKPGHLMIVKSAPEAAGKPIRKRRRQG